MAGNHAHDLYRRAAAVLPGGVTAAARANPALGEPFYVASAEGAHIVDPDGRRFIDLCMSNGATLLGHGHPAIVAAVNRAAARGIACAYDGPEQVELAERLVEEIPAFEQVRFTTSGTEATWYTVRIARAATGRPLVLKFQGHFHGFNDALAFNFWPKEGERGASAAPVVRPETAGLPPGADEHIIVTPFNDAAEFTRAIDWYGDQLAAVIMEPINFDSGAIMPDRAFLDLVRAETRRRGIVLIFDEILSGYRTGSDGAQGYLGVTPDMCTLGKALGGGVPISVFGGRRELMAVVAPLGPAVHTGTYNANLIPVSAALAFLEEIAAPGFYPGLLLASERLVSGLRACFRAAGVPVRVQGIGARFALYTGLDPDREVTHYREAAQLDWPMLRAFCRAMHRRGVYVNPAWHHGLCAASTPELIDQVLDAAAASARSMVAQEGGAVREKPRSGDSSS